MTNGAGGSHGKGRKAAAGKKRGEKGEKTPSKRKALLTAGLAKEKPGDVK
jgi:hypothetical protein